MVYFGYLQVTSLIMYLIGLYQGKLRTITDCEYVCSFSENYQYCYLLVSLCWICTIFHPMPAEREDRWVGGTICGSGWTSCRFVSCAHFEILHLGNKQGGNLEAQIFWILSLTARHDVPERFTGPADAFARRTSSGSGHYGEHTKHRTLLDSLMASKMVRTLNQILLTFILDTWWIGDHACTCHANLMFRW